MDHAIISSLLLLALIALANMQVIHNNRWDVPESIREILSLESVHGRKVRDTGVTNSSSSNNGSYSIEKGDEVGICLNITMKKEIKYEVRRKSSLSYSYKTGCTSKTVMDCYEPHVDYTDVIVPEKYAVKVRDPFCCNGYIQVANRSSGTDEDAPHISTSFPVGDIYCKPQCDPPCINGTCISPNKCGCPKEMILLEDGRTCVRPKCDPECINADCIGDNTCKCHRSYVREEAEPNICLPYCAHTCRKYSYCYMPNECRCLKNHIRNSIGECEPVCQTECVNGFCSGTNECTCSVGFKKMVGSSNKCEPACENCDNGVCNAPGLCVCNDLYKYDEKTKACTPKCQENCTSGCDEPMQCNDCGEGYKRANDSLLCEPECRGCSDGKCLAPGVCVCQDGYIRDMKDNDCIPKCVPGCENGVCSAPNTCSCLKGYHLVSDNVCESDTESCKRTIEDKMKLLPNNDSCIHLDEPLKLYTDNCSVYFTNSSCFKEHCSITNVENHSVCHMQYMCDFIQVPSLGMQHTHRQLQCRWRDSKIIKINTTSVQFESSTSMAMDNSITNMQDPPLPLFFFRSDFDIEPCLLCLCPIDGQRNLCWNGSYQFGLCPCVSERARIIRDADVDFFQRYNNMFHYILYAVYFLLSLVLIIVALKITCSKRKPDSQTYTVSSFSNDLYNCEDKFEEAEHVYAEIESDAYEQPRNIILQF